MSTVATPRISAPAARVGADLGRVLAVAVAQASAGFRDHLKGCRGRCAAESVHALRIHARRLLTLCDLFEALEPDPGIAECRRRIKRIQQAVARLRDTQVLISHLESAPPAAVTGAALWRRRLVKEARQLRRRAVRRSRKFHSRRLTRALGTGVRRLRKQGRKVGRPAAQARAARRWLDTLFARVMDRHAQAEVARFETIHQLRIALKHFRYAIEALSPWLPGVTAGYRRRLQTLQRRLGETHDAEVFLARLDEATAGHPRRAAKLLRVRQWMVRCRAARLRRLDKVMGLIPGLWPLATAANAANPSPGL